MSTFSYVGPSLMALLFLAGCENTPTVTRTGDVKDIIIGDVVSALAVWVKPGDEVRWVNKRTAPVRIVFLDPVNEKLSCKNNIGGWMSRSDTIRLDFNESASACFRDVGPVRYTVQMASALPSGEMNVPGIILVGEKQGDAAKQSIVRENEQLLDPATAPPGVTSTTTTTTTMPSK